MVSGGCQATWGEEDKEEEGVEEGAWAARHTPMPVWRARGQTDTHREREGERESERRVKISVPDIAHSAKVARGQLLSGCVSSTAALVQHNQKKKWK